VALVKNALRTRGEGHEAEERELEACLETVQVNTIIIIIVVIIIIIMGVGVRKLVEVE
jgi:hypothetical protein